ncbi:MAG TPA: isoprenylcysteine carboxylmethyltransferase family protein [Candidatus Acidoferrum sp.]|nr:isoprenylcysteine carboxylmethyltransferase family protein [Candidatus Acidoferrum sp.]
MKKSGLSITKQAIIGLSALAILLWVALFLPAWTLNYWQAWTYWLVFLVCVTAVSAYFLKKDLNLIASRLKVGAAEKENTQKITQAVISVFFILLVIVPSIDHHYKWSPVPYYMSLTGDVFVVLGLFMIFLVFKENSYTSVLVEVNEGQEVISSGPYGKVRHPMYSGALVMLLFTPLALGSFWGLLAFPPILAAIVVRIVGEEKFLIKNLEGYGKYCHDVRYRLIPFVW